MKDFRSFELRILRCPECQGTLRSPGPAVVCCVACEKVYGAKEDILDLRIDPGYDTLLDIDSYDGEHGVNEKSAREIFGIYEGIFERYGLARRDDVLEIGSGSGNLTYGLAGFSTFSTIHCSDLSPGFMNRLRQRVAPVDTEERVLCYLFDANHLPFIDESVDAVVGHSVLHHFAHFERTIEDAFRVLRPGGVAVFGEPVLDTNVFASLAASLIRAFDARQPTPELTAREDKILEVIEGRSTKKIDNLLSDRTGLEEIEDKFVFPIHYMSELSKRIGFANFECASPTATGRFSDLVRPAIARVFRQEREDDSKLDAFDFIFDAIDATYGTAMQGNLKALFSFFVFQK